MDSTESRWTMCNVQCLNRSMIMCDRNSLYSRRLVKSFHWMQEFIVHNSIVNGIVCYDAKCHQSKAINSKEMLQWHIFQKRSTNAIHDGQAMTFPDTMKRRIRPKCTWSFALLSVFGPFAFMRITFAMPCPVLCWLLFQICNIHIIKIQMILTWVKWCMHKTIHVPFTTIRCKKIGCHSE